jgi:hypothetical protein
MLEGIIEQMEVGFTVWHWGAAAMCFLSGCAAIYTVYVFLEGDWLAGVLMTVNVAVYGGVSLLAGADLFGDELAVGLGIVGVLFMVSVFEPETGEKYRAEGDMERL